MPLRKVNILFTLLMLFTACACFGQLAVKSDTVSQRGQYFTLTKNNGALSGIIPANYYTHNFGFFCKQELKMYKAKIPVSFRLGSMEQTDRLEQKRNTAELLPVH